MYPSYPASPYPYGPQAFPAQGLIPARPPKANPFTAVTAGALAVLGSFAHGFLAIFAGMVILAGGTDFAPPDQDPELAQPETADPDGGAVAVALVILPVSLCVAIGLIVGAVLLFSRVAAGRYTIIATATAALLPWLALMFIAAPIGAIAVLFPLATIALAAWSSTGRWIAEQRVPYRLATPHTSTA